MSFSIVLAIALEFLSSPFLTAAFVPVYLSQRTNTKTAKTKGPIGAKAIASQLATAITKPSQKVTVNSFSNSSLIMAVLKYS